VIHAQQAVHQLFEVRSVILAESVCDHKGLIVAFPLVEQVIPVDLMAVVSWCTWERSRSKLFMTLIATLPSTVLYQFAVTYVI